MTTDYVGRWDCESCGTQVWGIMKHCPKCGAGCTGKYYLPENEPPSTLEEVKRLVQAGPNWVCKSCNSDNWGTEQFCSQCGDSREGTKRRQVKEYDSADVPRSAEEAETTEAYKVVAKSPHSVSDSGDSRSSSSDASSSYSSAYQPVHTSYDEPVLDDAPGVSPLARLTEINWGCNATWMVGVLVMVAACYFIYQFFRPYEVQAEIAGFEWSWNIDIQEYRTVNEGSWSLPSGARSVVTSQRIHHYDRVLDHYETRTRQVPESRTYQCGSTITDNGDGTFSESAKYCTETTYRKETYEEAVYRDEPVYQTWYQYDIDKWVASRNVPTSGTARNDPEPHWGELTLKCAGEVRLGCEREAGREQHFYVIFRWEEDEEEKTHRWEEDSQDDWNLYDREAEYTLVVNKAGMLLNDPLHPEEVD